MKKIWEFIGSVNHSRTTAVLVILILFASVPLTVFVAQKQQQTQQHADTTSVYLQVAYPDGKTGYINQFTGTSYTPDQVDKIPGGVPKSTTTFDPTIPNQGPIVNDGTNPIYPISGGPANNITIPQDPTTLAQTTCQHKTTYCSGEQVCVDQVINSVCTPTCNTCSGGNTCQPDSLGGAACQTPILSCAASPNPANTNQTITFTGSGGANIYTWAFPNGTPPTGSGKSSTTSYSVTGTYTATMTDTSINKTAQCTVTVGSGGTTLNLVIGFDGVGSTGDRKNPDSSGSNKNPQNIPMQATVEVFDANGQTVKTQNAPVVFDQASGKFKGATNVDIPTGIYTVKVKLPGHLRKKAIDTQTITSGQTVTVSADLSVGDINNDNAVNITDYNILISCWLKKDNGNACGNFAQNADFNMDGVINETDYSLFLRDYLTQSGD